MVRIYCTLALQLLWISCIELTAYQCTGRQTNIHTFLLHVHCLDLAAVENLDCNLVAGQYVLSYFDLENAHAKAADDAECLQPVVVAVNIPAGVQHADRIH